MKLVISEKPSGWTVFREGAGTTKQGDGYLKRNGYNITWCVGHLVELAQPEAYDERYSKWQYEGLPILSDKFKYRVIPEKKKQVEIISKLMNSVGKSLVTSERFDKKEDAEDLRMRCGDEKKHW